MADKRTEMKRQQPLTLNKFFFLFYNLSQYDRDYPPPSISALFPSFPPSFYFSLKLFICFSVQKLHFSRHFNFFFFCFLIILLVRNTLSLTLQRFCFFSLPISTMNLVFFVTPSTSRIRRFLLLRVKVLFRSQVDRQRKTAQLFTFKRFPLFDSF